MPIRLNLLAEQHAAEDARRRDPVKRATWIGGFVVSLVAGRVVILQAKSFAAGSSLAAEQGRLKSLEKSSHNAAASLKRTADIERRLGALQALATNRFLWAGTLDSLQRVMVDNVQVMRIRADQNYSVVTRRLTDKDLEKNPKARPPECAQERITLLIEARDFANPADLNYNKFISAVSGADGFKGSLAKTDGITLKDRLPSQPDPSDPRRRFILFSIECRYPEKQRTL